MDSTRVLIDKLSLRVLFNLIPDVDSKAMRLFELLIENGCPYSAIAETFKQLAKEDHGEKD